jgi:gliding motility-associated-like protein
MLQKLHIVFICIFLAISSPVIAQNVCTDPKYQVGGFDVSSLEICVGRTLSIINQSSGTNLKYVYDYKGESLTNALANATPNISNIYTKATTFPTQPFQKEVTILQIGEKNASPIVACKKVIVRTSDEPIMSWDLCGIRRFDLTVPVHPLNDYDSYVIDLGTGVPVQIKNKADLPFSISQDLPTVPRNVSITGRYNIKPLTCPNVVPFQVTNVSAFIQRPYFSNIDKIELLSKSEALITFTGAFTAPPNDYTLYGYGKGQHAATTKPIQVNNIIPGDIKITLPNPNLIYCFYAERTRTCGLKERSAEICTHPLTSIIALPNQTSTTVNWTSYPNNTMFGLPQANANFQTIKRIKFSDPPIPRSQIIGQGSPQFSEDNPTLPNPASAAYDCKYKNCYRVEMSISGRVPGSGPPQVQFKSVSISNTLCSDRSNVVPPPISKLYVDTKYDASQTEHFQINLKPNTVTPWALAKNRWILYKMDNGVPVKLDSAAGTGGFITDPRLPKESTEYKVGYVDRCESRSALSPPVNSVYLDHKGGSTIFWTPKSPFNFGDILYYEVVPLVDSTLAPMSNIKKVQKGTYQSIVSIGDAKDAAPFYVKIYSDSTLVSFVRTNTTFIPIALNFYAPTAFSPNGDGKNDAFFITGAINKIDQFFIQIFDRFGNLVFETNNPAEKWDGTFKNRDLPNGDYSYKITIRLKSGQLFKKNGSVAILR